MNASDYRRQLELLLPTGTAIEPIAGSRLAQFLDGIARELARVEGRGVNLLDEADPNTATELFSEWLEIAGIPDSCSARSSSPGDERAQLVQKLSKQGGQTVSFFVELANAYGYTSRIQEFSEFQLDRDSVGAPVQDEPWVHAFSVVLSEPPVLPRAGVAMAGDRLGAFEADLLFCVIQKAKAAQVVGFVGFE